MSPHDPGKPAVDPAVEEARALFEREAATIEASARSLCRRYGLQGDEADDFVSSVMVRMLDDDLAVLRKFQGRSSLKTYLGVVVARVYQDHRVERLGRWRPSTASREMGPTGVLLDAFLNRRGYTLDEAIRVLLSRDDVAEDEATLRAWAARIPRRPLRSFTGDTGARALPGASRADDALSGAEDERRREHAREALERGIGSLPEQDQLLVRMRYWEGLTLAAIARVLRIEQKPLYRRMEANLRRLRAFVEEAGFAVDDLRELLP